MFLKSHFDCFVEKRLAGEGATVKAEKRSWKNSFSVLFESIRAI